MPNSEVKRISADGSVGLPHVRVGHRQALNLDLESNQCGAVVQLVRIPACHAGGRGFESRPLRHLFQTSAEMLRSFCICVLESWNGLRPLESGSGFALRELSVDTQLIEPMAE